MSKIPRILFVEDSIADIELALAPFVLLDIKMEKDTMQSYQLGANGFVIKPIDFSEFVKTIKGIGYFWAIINTSPMTWL